MYDSLAYSGNSVFDVEVYGNKYGGNKWSDGSKINKYFNDYPCSLRLSTKLTIEDMGFHLDGVSAVKSGN